MAKQNNNETPLPTEADLKKIVNRLSKRAPEIADAKAQVECATVALRNLKAKLDKLVAEQEADEDLVKIWAANEPERFADAPKGVDIGKAVVTLKKNPPSICNIENWSDDDVIAACEKAGHEEYVRIVKKFERAVVKADFNGKRIDEKALKKLGLYVSCEAEFKVKLKD